VIVVALPGEFWCCQLKSDRGVVSTSKRKRERRALKKFREFRRAPDKIRSTVTLRELLGHCGSVWGLGEQLVEVRGEGEK
jgi:hypothetical protein